MVTSCALGFNRSSFVGPASCGEVSCKKRLSSGKSDDRSSSPADRLHRNTTLSRFAVTIGKGYDDVTRRVGIVVDQPVTGFPDQLRRPSTAIPFHADQDNFPCQRLCGAVRASPTRLVQDKYRPDPCRVTVATSGSWPVSCAVESAKLSSFDDLRELNSL